MGGVEQGGRGQGLVALAPAPTVDSVRYALMRLCHLSWVLRGLQ